MSHWESKGITDEWYTPQYIFDAMECGFDLDVAHPAGKIITPSFAVITENSLSKDWDGFIWMNAPFGGRNSLVPWLEKFFNNSGVALTPDRTSAPWYQYALHNCSSFLLIRGKVRFIRPNGTEGKSPSTGTTLFASGEKGSQALRNASKNGLGIYCEASNA
jgi:hypothetical protein